MVLNFHGLDEGVIINQGDAQAGRYYAGSFLAAAAAARGAKDGVCSLDS